MNVSLFIILLFTLQVIYWYVGRKAAKQVITSEDYFLAGKKTRFFPLMLTLLAAEVGGGLVLGAAEEAYIFGWPVLLYPLGSACGLMLLGTGIGRRMVQFPVTTVAEIFEVAYGSVLLRKVASVLSMTTLFIILIVQIIASHKFLSSAGFGMPLFLIFWGIVFLYTVQGGLKAVISTDIVQALFFSFALFLCIGIAWYHHPTVLQASFKIENSAISYSKICTWLLMPFLFNVVSQDIAQKCFAGNSPRTVQKASFVAGVCDLMICCIPVCFGVLAKVAGLVVPVGSSVLMTAIEYFTSPVVAAVVGCAVLAAIISTATSLISAISSNLSHDIIGKNAQLRVIRSVSTGIALLALGCGLFLDDIVDLLMQSFELSISSLFVPIIFALFKKKGNSISAMLAVLFGALGFWLLRFYPMDIPREVMSLCLSILGYYVGEALIYLKEGMKYENSQLY